MPNYFLRVSACALALAFLCLGLGAGPAAAQSQGSLGAVSGSVVDTNGASIPNATVKVVNKQTGLERQVTTSEDGLYSVGSLPPGMYTVSAVSGGFAEVTLPEVEVQVGRTTDANITLGAGGVQEVVNVTAEGIQATRSESDAVLNQTAIETLPINGRRFQDFVTLTPAAQVDPQRGQISLSGQKGINSNINVDGVDYNQPFFGGIRGGERSNLAFTIPQESIKEFQVVASGYSAEFGRSTGGIVNAVTKSGGNDVRGSAFWLYRPSGLARGNEYTQALQEQRLSAAGVDATLAPTQHQFGGSVGGPIIKNKLFYFGAYEQQVFNAPRQIVFNFPAVFPVSGQTVTAGQQSVLDFYKGLQNSYELTNDAFAALGRIDWQVNASNQFNARFNASRNEAENAVSRGETSLDPTTNQALSTNGVEKNKTRIFVSQLISTLSPNAVNEFRFQYAREDRPRDSNSEIPQIQTSFATLGATNFLPTTQFDTRYQIADAFTYIAGNHNFKFGGEYSRLFANQRFGFNQFGQYQLNLGATCVSATNCTFGDTLQRLSNTVVPGTNAILGRFDSTTARYNRQIGNLLAEYPVHELAFFGQDTWRATRTLTFNYGLRAEQQYNPEPEVSNTAVANVVRNTNFPIYGHGYNPSIPDSGWQFGPRAGFAWDPGGDGKMVLRGFTGYYYARTPLIVLADSTNNYRLPPANVSVQLGTFAASSQTPFNNFLATPAGQNYINITGCNPAAASGTDARNRCTPNTVYRQFAIAGVNLNTFALDALPVLSLEQIATINSALGLNANPFVNAQVTGHAEDFKNPRSFQFGFAFERELARNFVFGIDYAHVKTDRIQRNRDLNLPAPLTGAQYVQFLQANNTAANFNTMVANGLIDAFLNSGRSYIAITAPGGRTCSATVTTECFPSGVVNTRQRPTQAQQGFALGAVQVRESTAKSLYRGLTFRTRYQSRWANLNAYYTWSRLLGDDDNERDAGGVAYADPYDLRREYYRSRLDREHQFVANPIFFLPYDFEVSSAIRLRSGNPVNANAGGDLNGDNVFNDRPLLVPGVTYPRNAFRNRGLYDVDLRVQKSFRFGEVRRLIFTSEFFNVLNRSNIIFPNPGTNTTVTAGQFCSQNSQLCGLSGPSNPAFLRVTDVNTGAILVGNTNPGSQVFQMQLGARFQF